MTEEAGYSPLDDQIAGAVAPHATLLSIDCVGLEARHVAWLEVANLGYEVIPVQPVWARTGGSVNAIFAFNLDIHTTDAQGIKTSFVRVNVAYRISYGISDEINTNDVRHFVGVSGFMHLWPYLRAEVQYLTTQIGLPPLVLPLMRSGNASEFVRIGGPNEEPPPAAPKLPGPVTAPV